jgi:PAS domain S-box-containing protein
MKRILIVDNNVLLLEFMRDLLDDQGYQVKTASGGLEALEQVPSFRPDLVFVDLVMPEIDGKRLCRMLRNEKTSRSSYIVVLSAIAAEDRELDVTAYADAYVAKAPFKLLKENILTLLVDFEAGRTEGYADTVVGVDDIYTREITRELLQSKRHMDVILQNISDGFMEITSKAFTILFANESACAFLGLEEEQLISLYFPELFSADSRERVEEALASLHASSCTLGEEGDLFIGSRRVLLKCSHVVHDHYSSILLFMEDITERKRSEQIIRSSLREKELLLQEVHHRVKNNFQIVSSILNLQSNSSDDEAVQEVLRISQNRIDAMSLIHENIYRSENLTRIMLDEYFEDLLNRLVATYAGGRVEIHVDTGGREMDLVSAIPLGLIVNELVTNSLLHGSTDAAGARLSVTMEQEDESNLLLTVRDNGSGYPEELMKEASGKETSDSLGLLIVYNLAHQLGGEASFYNDRGAVTAVRFPPEQPS